MNDTDYLVPTGQFDSQALEPNKTLSAETANGVGMDYHLVFTFY